VEEPLPCESQHSGVTILTPVLSAADYHGGGFNAGNNDAIRMLLSDYFPSRLDAPDVVAWYYTPMALGALPPELEVSATIFDAMDELSKFRGAPAALRDQERRLMRVADLVFAGGPSLHEARKHLHSRAFCFPSGVDADHFRPDGVACPTDIQDFSGPVIGFYGVIDERVDLELVASIADARPDWTVLMIGPLAKISEADLPRRANIRYLGMRTYEQLPAYLARFDAAILPFAINEATRFISPTKTLEYLSGGKPVVSTAIKDVIDLYGDVIEVASGPEEFVAAIERLWQESPGQQAIRAQRVAQTLEEHDWDAISSSMVQLLHEVLNERELERTQLVGTTIHTAAAHTSAASFRQETAD
jgi:glycosyltransferase involved in cell wall biosynthesis